MALDFKEITKALIDTLKADSGLTTLVGTRIYTFVPQDSLMPYIKALVDVSSEMDTKTDDGMDQEIRIDIWSDKKGILEITNIMNSVYNILHNQPFTGLTGQQAICLQFQRFNKFIEPDTAGITHGVLTFRLLLSES